MHSLYIMEVLTNVRFRRYGVGQTNNQSVILAQDHGMLNYILQFPDVTRRQALAYGARFAGCTVHFVDEGTDTCPVILQAAVPILPGDDEGTLAARILEQEHRLYPQAVQWFAQGRLSLRGRTVQVAGGRPPESTPVVNPRLDSR